ncbi:putative phosphatidate phosphatase [Artemia franciscana]|uniref:putative phosphatidate phosphatase n=1 Tax=Artemia franciscana TaxID=6661 RepID=UPI0032DAFE78
MVKKKTSIYPRILDAILLLCCKFTRSHPPTWSMIILLVCTYSGVIPAKTAGFYCNDLSIKHIYKGDTVGTMELLAIIFAVPFFFFFFIERFQIQNGQRVMDSVLLKRAFDRTVAIYRTYFVGQVFVMTAVEVSKTIISEPRPHFLDTCKPNITEETCIGDLYITSYSCLSGNKPRKITDSQKSFPSGHAAVSFFAAFYMIWYLSKNLDWIQSYLLKPVLQLLWVLLALICSLTRIIDKRHHWWDVLAGAVFGNVVALIIVMQSKSELSKPVAVERSLPNNTTIANDSPMHAIQQEDKQVFQRLLPSCPANSPSDSS